MSNNIWVCKHDGTIQCQPDVNEISLQDARAELVEIIGAQNVLRGEKRITTVIQLCGSPTGNHNAFELTDEGYELLVNGAVGPLGWEKCPGEVVP